MTGTKLSNLKVEDRKCLAGTLQGASFTPGKLPPVLTHSENDHNKDHHFDNLKNEERGQLEPGKQTLLGFNLSETISKPNLSGRFFSDFSAEVKCCLSYSE